MNLSRLTAIAALSLAGTFAVAGPATASGGGGDIRTSGSCSAGSTWKMKAKPDDGRIEVQLEIDSNRVGQTWSVNITDNAVRVFSGNRVTTAPSGSFEVEVISANRAGTDSFLATARNARTGELCRGSVKI